MVTIIDRPDLRVTVEADGEHIRLDTQLLLVGQTTTVAFTRDEARTLMYELSDILDELDD